jgi:hypothetical protein
MLAPLRKRAVLGLVAGAIAVPGLAACGGDDEESAAPGEGESAAPAEGGSGTASLEHIHGLGTVDDGSLFIATHTGLFRAPDGETKVEQVGDSQQDIMGFSVQRANRFIGSGHPDPRDSDQPPNLGLIESRDGGRTWQSVSLLGEADFHVLESAGNRIYGFDGTQGRFMASDDGGESWDEHEPPAAMFDVGIHPEDPLRLLAATETGLHASTNGGKSWRSVNDQIAGLLAWPAGNDLYLVDGRGQVMRSSDGGKEWEQVGSIGGEPAAFIGRADELYAGLHDGSVKRSRDGGESWEVRATP